MSIPAREDEKMAAYDMFCKGVPICEIAKHFHRKKNTVSSWVKNGNWHERRDEIRKVAMEQIDENNIQFNARRQIELEKAIQSVLQGLPNAMIKSKEGALSSVVHATKEQRELRGLATQGMTISLVFPNINRPNMEALQSQAQLAIPSQSESSGNKN